jgi:hypothetical protein
VGAIFPVFAVLPPVRSVLHCLKFKKNNYLFSLCSISVPHSVRPKRVNTETTETEISVWFTEPKPKIPNRNSEYITFFIQFLILQKIGPPNYFYAFLLTSTKKFIKFLTFWPTKYFKFWKCLKKFQKFGQKMPLKYRKFRFGIFWSYRTETNRTENTETPNFPTTYFDQIFPNLRSK